MAQRACSGTRSCGTLTQTIFQTPEAGFKGRPLFFVMIEDPISLADEILSGHRRLLAEDFDGYRNHVFRMLHFCFAQGELVAEKREKVIIAGCFHDLGIWPTDTLDYLPPSIELANEYLSKHGLEAWRTEISLMIDMHHRLRKCSDDPLVETFRKGDLIDFSLGIFKCGISPAFIRDVKNRFPNAGFHKKLVKLAGKWVLRHPFNPVPVIKW